MKKFQIILICLIFLNMYYCLSQKHIKKLPVSFSYNSNLKPITYQRNLPEIIMHKFNIDSVESYEKNLDNQGIGRPYRFGYSYNVKYNLENSGIWDTLENGSRIWRHKIICNGAFSINLIYSKFHLPDSALFFIYNENHDYILGAFTSNNNKKHGKFATDLVKGDSIILEIFEPFKSIGRSIVEISRIIHGYKNLFKYESVLLKENKIQETDCNDEVNCSEGDEWCREKYSVSRILVDGDHLCTGSLLNNVREDYTPYYLTANHCTIDEDPDVWVFQFGYMYENCDGGSTLSTYSYSGADLKANWSTSDFALLELQEQPEPGENNFPDVYYNGWDNTGNVPNNTTCLHHRQGERMKIAMDYNSPTSSNYHWDTYIDFGWITFGSSGAPLFTPDHKVIGQVHGGTPVSPCNVPHYVYFGKFSDSWNGGGTSSTRLKDWLDPDNTGVDILDGIHLPNYQWGYVVLNGMTFNRKAYNLLCVGSGDIPSPFRIESGGTSNLKAGKEIQILPCTQIISGASFHAYIEELDCEDVVNLSDTWDEHTESCGYWSLMENKFDNTLTIINNLYNNYKLFHNIPNPFSSLTEINYSIPVPSPVVIEVYNSIGMPVAELVNMKSQYAGEHKVTFDAKNLPDGVYFYTLRTPEFTETKQMILIK